MSVVEMPTNRLLLGQDGHMIHFAQMSNNGTITAGPWEVRRAATKPVRASRQEAFPGLGSETVSNGQEALTRGFWRDGPVVQRWRADVRIRHGNRFRCPADRRRRGWLRGVRGRPQVGVS